jgi:hypothetical protein
MHTLYALSEALRSPRARRMLGRVRAEASALAAALLSPGKLVAEVESIHKLKKEADRIEERQPGRAAVLRRRAAQLCLR